MRRHLPSDGRGRDRMAPRRLTLGLIGVIAVLSGFVIGSIDSAGKVEDLFEVVLVLQRQEAKANQLDR